MIAMSVVSQLEKTTKKRKRLSPGDAIEQYLDGFLACDIEDQEREALLKHRDDMTASLRSDFIKRGIHHQFRLLDDRCDVRGISALIISENCVAELMRHLRCTLQDMPICRGVLRALLQVFNLR